MKSASSDKGLDPEIAGPILKEVTERLSFLTDVGLGYLTLGRSATSLSGGEAQRIRLATQIGSRLVGVLYILDELSIGLHPRDNKRLLSTLTGLRDLGNTVIVVEHDEETIRAADHVVDLGPRAGRDGGELIAEGQIEVIESHPTSLTGRYLRRELRIDVPSTRRPLNPRQQLVVKGAKQHNLKNIEVVFPTRCVYCRPRAYPDRANPRSSRISSTAPLQKHLYRSKQLPGTHDRVTGLVHLDKVLDIDQSPIGRTPRSNPATYTGIVYTDSGVVRAAE